MFPLEVLKLLENFDFVHILFTYGVVAVFVVVVTFLCMLTRKSELLDMYSIVKSCHDILKMRLRRLSCFLLLTSGEIVYSDVCEISAQIRERTTKDHSYK